MCRKTFLREGNHCRGVISRNYREFLIAPSVVSLYLTRLCKNGLCKARKLRGDLMLFYRIGPVQ